VCGEPAPTPDPTLVVVSNRLPVRRDGEDWELSAGGLVTALQPVMAQRPGLWVGWDGDERAMPSTVDGMAARLHPIELTQPQVQGHYRGFSNRTLWPLFHDLLERPVIDRAWWHTYREVNEAFADATAAAVAEAGLATPHLWVHDYHLLLLPAMLRERLPDARIGFFLHVPWPPPELFARLPWRDDILEGLLGADLISFHTDRYRKNFARTCGRVLDELGVAVRRGTIELPDGRQVRTLANPISIDADEFADRATSPQVETHLSELREQFTGRRVLLGVDRLDYTKGIVERLEAFEQLLARRKDLRGQLTLVQVAVPSRESVREYRELRETVEWVIGRINGKFTTPGSDVPVHYLHRGVSRDQLLAYYRAADTMLVTPVKDGMNLVAKEFVICQHAAGGSGALVLSEFTGSALELREAVRCNPFDIEGLARRLEVALVMTPEERRDRLARMARRVHRGDVYRWIDRELDALRAPQPRDHRPGSGRR
jgi:trehalose 6-phosphate synthase